MVTAVLKVRIRTLCFARRTSGSGPTCSKHSICRRHPPF
jgi:hypothetical protein